MLESTKTSLSPSISWLDLVSCFLSTGDELDRSFTFPVVIVKCSFESVGFLLSQITFPWRFCFFGINHIACSTAMWLWSWAYLISLAFSPIPPWSMGDSTSTNLLELYQNQNPTYRLTSTILTRNNLPLYPILRTNPLELFHLYDILLCFYLFQSPYSALNKLGQFSFPCSLSHIF